MGPFDYMFMPYLFEGLTLTAIDACFTKIPVIINLCDGRIGRNISMIGH